MRKAILLVNLGTPTSPTYFALRKYLKQFLSDRRVVNKNRIFWLSLLNIVLLQIIPQRSAKNYAKIWNKIRNESPLLSFTKQQVQALQNKLGDDYIVDFAFTYDAGVKENSIANKLNKYKLYDDITVLPLYPQYSTATTASIEDQVNAANPHNVKLINNYHDETLYIKALANSLQNVKYKDIVVSFHGLPVEYIKQGDPYQAHCEKTFELLKAEFKDKNFYLTYQSKFGKDEWLSPATDATVIKLAEQGLKDLAIITPGFAVDCIETLEEVAMGIKDDFIEHGGNNFEYIPCLNDSDDAIALFKKIVK